MLREKHSVPVLGHGEKLKEFSDVIRIWREEW
jgi:hypothetical protein